MLFSLRSVSWHADFHGSWAYLEEAILKRCWCLCDWNYHVYAADRRWSSTLRLIRVQHWKVQEITTCTLIVQFPTPSVASRKEHLPAPDQVQHYNALHSCWSTQTSLDNKVKQDTDSNDSTRQNWKHGSRAQFPFKNRDDDFHVQCFLSSRVFWERWISGI